MAARVCKEETKNKCVKYSIDVNKWKGDNHMTLRDITDAMTVQGNLTVKQWNEEKETYNILAETDIVIIPENVLDMEITYMYAIDNGLIVEVE